MSSAKPDSREGGRRTRTGGAKSNRQPEVSIVTIVLNDQAYIEETIQSVLSQSCESKEYIIVDGGSTDGTLDKIRKFDDQIDYWVTEPDDGVYDAMNKGIGHCAGRIIKIINSGDTLCEGAVDKALAQFSRNVGSEKRIVRSFLNITSLDGNVIGMTNNSNASRYYPSILHPTWYVPKTVYDEVGLYSKDYAVAADYEYFRRAKVRNVKFTTICEPLVCFRIGGISGSGLKGQHEVFRINRQYQGLLIAAYVYGINIGARVLNRVKRIGKVLKSG